MKKLIIFITAAVSISVIAGCANNLSGSNRDSMIDDGFNLSGNLEGDSKHGHFMEKRMNKFFKELNLTEEQKKSFLEIKQQVRGEFKKNKVNREEFKNLIKTTFLSDSINKDELKEKLENLKPKNEEKINKIAENIVKIYGILTPEQRVKIENKLNEMEGKIKGFANNPIAKIFKPSPEKKFAKMLNGLDLNEVQKEKLKGVFDNNSDFRKQKLETASKIKNEIQTELKNGANTDKIRDILKTVKVNMESGIDNRIETMIKVHDILTVEQRKKLVENIEKRHDKMHKKLHSKLFSNDIGV